MTASYRNSVWILMVMSPSPLYLLGCGGGTEAAGSTTIPLVTTSIVPPTGSSTTTSAVSTTTTTKLSLWNCSTKCNTVQITHPIRKGIAIDDATMSECVNNVGIWPHSNDVPTTSLRLFTGWKHGFDARKRKEAWQYLKDYVDKTNAKILFGVEYGKDYDDQSWDWTFELMKMIGPEHTMGVGFGNEVDVFGDADYFRTNGPIITKMKASVKQMDAAGFQDIPITTVFTAGIIAHIEGKARAFLQQAHDTFGERFVFSFNPYSIWDLGLMNLAKQNCRAAVESATSIKYIQDMTKGIRGKIVDLTGGNDFKLWLTEAGWSAPGVETPGQRQVVNVCGDWASYASLFKMYKGVMEWDLTFEDGTKAADHMFYFTIRDSRGESFGMVKDCNAHHCKMNDACESDASMFAV